MPIYEYECRECGNRFELLVLSATTPTCPACEGTELGRLMSLSSVASGGTRKRNLKRARAAGREVSREKAHAEHEAMHHYHEDHQ